MECSGTRCQCSTNWQAAWDENLTGAFPVRCMGILMDNTKETLIKLIQILIANCMIASSERNYEKEITESWQDIFKHIERQRADSYVEGYNKAKKDFNLK